MMDRKERLRAETWDKLQSSAAELQKQISPENVPFSDFGLQQKQQKWEDTSMLDYGMIESFFQGFNQPSSSNPDNQNKIMDCNDVQFNETDQKNKIQGWDPSTILNNLSFLEEKIHQLQGVVNMIVSGRGQVLGQTDDLVAQQQQLVTANLTTIIVQLISTAGTLLPSAKNMLSTTMPSVGQLGQLAAILCPSGSGFNNNVQPQQRVAGKVSDQSKQMDVMDKSATQHNIAIEEHEMKDEEDADEGENLPPGSYEILQLKKEEILAPHTHFCTICGKGFKRDANLRMHMRGHGDEYKTPAALAKPHKESSSEPVLIKRYSCPFAGCKRNRDHKKFQPLKTILCVKNHYKRTHCDKSYVCSRCNTKKFSVIADLKTHEKHCSKDKWLCSCGTTFSRKDKLFGHIALFQGHTPAIPPDETKGQAAGSSDKGNDNDAANKIGSINFSFVPNTTSGNETQNVMDMKGAVNDTASYFSPLNIDTCNFDGFHEFPRPPFDDSESSFSFLVSSACNYNQKAGGDPSSSDIS